MAFTKTVRKKKFGSLTGFLFALPAILGFVFFTLFPTISCIYFSFTDYNMISAPEFIGLENYQRLFSGEDPYFYESLWVTTYYTILSTPIALAFAFLLALLMEKDTQIASASWTLAQ